MKQTRPPAGTGRGASREPTAKPPKGAETMAILDNAEQRERRNFKKQICIKPSTMELLKAAAKRKGTTAGELIADILDLAADEERKRQAKEAKSKE